MTPQEFISDEALREAGMRRALQRKEMKEMTSKKEEMVVVGEKVWELNRVREAELVAAKGQAGVGENVREVFFWEEEGGWTKF